MRAAAVRRRVTANLELLDPAEARTLRQRAGLPAALAAQACGVHRATLLRWEAGACRPQGIHAESWWRLQQELTSLIGRADATD